MVDTVILSKAFARRVEKISIATKRKPEVVLKSALNKGLDYEEWFMNQVQAGIEEADRGELIGHEELVNNFQKLRKGIGRKRRQAA
jgi:predicted transcriptional regulator